MTTTTRSMMSRLHAIRVLALALGLALLPWRAVPAASLPELTPVPRSSRFT